jgi:hypothetical protein
MPLSFLTVCCALISGMVPLASAVDSSKGLGFTDKVVLAYYYTWFSENNWIQTTAEGGRKEGLAGLHPLVGAYNSWDPTIIEKHMQQMNRALIDALAERLCPGLRFNDRPVKCGLHVDVFTRSARFTAGDHDLQTMQSMFGRDQNTFAREQALGHV